MIIIKKTKKRIARAKKAIALFLLFTILNQIIAPTAALALTAGPTAPEATNFEPVDTTDMVNPLTGSFTYNMPLLEVPGPEGGYPLALSYHAGAQPAEEASWVGLGWSLNPGAIARNVNGYPDDWHGEGGTTANYWSGGSQSTYSIGVSVGIAGFASVGAGLEFSQDTYQGFGVGTWVEGKFGEGPLSIGVKVGVSPYGDNYMSLNVGPGVSLGGGLISASANIGIQTNFKSTEVGFSASIGLGSLLQASISSGNMRPSLSSGFGSITHVNDINAGGISTQSNGWSITIPIGIFSISLSHEYTRYWSSTYSNFAADGVLNDHASLIPSSYEDDNYSLLDPINSSIADSPDPLTVMGGTFPDFDDYSVTAQGLGGNMRPYIFSTVLYNQNRINNNDHTHDVYDEYFQVSNTYPLSKWQFRFINDMSNSYTQGHAWDSDSEYGFDFFPKYGNNDDTYGYDLVTNRLEGTNHIEYFTNAQINSGAAATRGFIDCQDAGGFNRTDYTKCVPTQIGGFMITNSSGVTYHYALPAYSSNEVYYTEKIDQSYGASNSTLTKPQPYAYTWYLTAITGPDYVSRGTTPGIISSNDWGYWVKFAYGKWVDDYKWRNPAIGFNKDVDNAFQSYSSGQKEVYYLDAAVTRTHTALFVKELRADAKSLGSNGFGYYNLSQSTNHMDSEPRASLRLNNILIIPNDELVSSISAIRSASTTYDYFDWRDESNNPIYAQHGSSVIDINDIAQLSENLNQKCIRKIQFNYDYSLCPGTPNSYDPLGQVYSTSPASLPSYEGSTGGKLTLRSIDLQGVGGASLTPPTQFQYDLDPTDPANKGTISIVQVPANPNVPGTIGVTAPSNFNVGDMLTYQVDGLYYYCTLISTPNNGVTYQAIFLGATPTVQVSNIHAVKTKNPPYGSHDNWGYYKSDYQQTFNGNDNLYHFTTAVSNKSTDAWCLRKIKSGIGADITVNYEGNTYNRSVLNKNRSLVINSAITKNSANNYTIRVNDEGLDLSSIYKPGDKLSMILEKYVYDTNNIRYIDNPFTIINSDTYPSEPIIQSISGDFITVNMDPKMGADMSSTSGYNYTGFYHGTTINGSPYNAVIIRGNVMANGSSLFYGGGIRVKDITVDDLNGQVQRTAYNYGVLGYPNNGPSTSGITSYEPIGLDLINSNSLYNYSSNADYNITTPYYDPMTVFKRELYKESTYLLSVAREVPAPGVMYEYVKVNNYNVLANGNVVPIEGSALYQYEVFKPEMVGIDQYHYNADNTDLGGTTSPSGSGLKLYTKHSRDMSIKDYTSRIGTLKRTITYDNLGNKLTEKINHYLYDDLENTSLQNQIANYEPRLSSYNGVSYNNMGEIIERYGTARAVVDGGHIAGNPANSEYNEMLVMSNRETFPNFLTGTTQIDYKNGTQMNQQNLAYDFYTGAVTQTLTTDSYGNRFINKVMPAYAAGGVFSLVYPALGLRTHDDNAGATQHKQMLTQQAANYTFSVDASNNPIGVVGASAQTWGNDVPVLDPDNNATTTGQSNIWRMKASYTWMPAGTATNNLTPYSSFADYYGPYGTPNGGSSNSAWKKTNQITQYNVYSVGLEASDINNNYSATRMGYSNSKVLVTATGARYNEIAYAGAEDALLTNGNFSNNISKGGGTVVTDSTNAHTGTNSLMVPASQTGFNYAVPIAQIGVKNYSASVWVKAQGGGCSCTGKPVLSNRQRYSYSGPDF